jgi:NADPH:quinone reductase
MQAIRVERFGGPEVLTLQEVPDPVAPPGHLVVRLHAAGVNPVEAYIRTGNYARLPPLPYTPGFDGAGDVDTYAERMVCTPQQVFPLPAHVSYAAGASLGVPAATAHRALFGKAQARAGETVLVHGASGAVGTAAVQLAQAAGLRVFGTAGTDDGLALVREQGAEQAFNHRDAGRVDAIRQATDGRGVDIVLEMLANANLDTDLALLAKGGRVIVIGSRGRVEIDPRQTMGKEAAVLGMTLWNVPPDEVFRIDTALTAALEDRTLRPVVGRELPLAEAARAHREILEGSGTAGKMVLAV